MGIYRGGHHRGYEKGLIKGNSSKGELIIGEIIQGMLSHLVRALTGKKSFLLQLKMITSPLFTICT